MEKNNPYRQYWYVILHNVIHCIGRTLYLIELGLYLTFENSNWFLFLICIAIIMAILSFIWIITNIFHLRYFLFEEKIKENKIKKIVKIENLTLNYIAWWYLN